MTRRTATRHRFSRSAWPMARSQAEFARLLRYGLNGMLNTATSYLLFVVFVRAGVPVFPSLLLSSGTAILTNFFTSRHFVFRSAASGVILRFLLVYAVLLGLNCMSLRVLALLGLPSWATQAFLILPIAAAGYLAQRNFVFGARGTAAAASSR